MKQPPLCRYCGAKIAKSTFSVYFGSSGYLEKRQERPTNKAEAQRLINNGTVLSIARDYTGREVRSANVWDGESYVSEYFCNGKHAKQFAYVIAKAGHFTVAYQKAYAKQLKRGNDQNAAA